MLRRIVKVVAPATSARPLVPTHFSETVLIAPTEDGGVLFSCCDGFHLHEVETFKGMVNYSGDGPLVVGIGWLQSLLGRGKSERWIELTATPHPDASRFVDMWIVSATWASSDTTLTEDGQSFDIGGKWPNPSSLIDYDAVSTDATGFNPVFFKAMVNAAMTWWDRDTPDEALPLVVKQMHPQKQSTFTIRNAIGRLKMSLMPKIMDTEEY